jgi:hypothetical protein
VPGQRRGRDQLLYAIPRTSFTIYTYSDPDDPVVVAVTTTTTDFFLTQPDEVAPHETSFKRLHKSALSQEKSLDLITEAAARLSGE